MTTAITDGLPCGNSAENLLAYAADRTTPPPGSHEAGCPFCQAAISEFTQLWAPVRQWASREVHVPEGFVTTVMNRVRRLVQSPRHVAQITARGTTTVTSWVLGLIASDATRRTAGVSAMGGRGAVRYGADTVDIEEVGASDIAVSVSLTAGPVPNLMELADTVRHNIITALYRETGIHAEVNITIDDLDQEPTPPAA